MDTAETVRLCKELEYAAAQVRTLIGDRTDITEVLDRFWRLQDSLYRLVNAVDGECSEISRCRKLIRYVVSTLESSQTTRWAKVPAVRDACDKINNLLIRLERTTQEVSTGPV